MFPGECGMSTSKFPLVQKKINSSSLWIIDHHDEHNNGDFLSFLKAFLGKDQCSDAIFPNEVGIRGTQMLYGSTNRGYKMMMSF